MHGDLWLPLQHAESFTFIHMDVMWLLISMFHCSMHCTRKCFTDEETLLQPLNDVDIASRITRYVAGRRRDVLLFYYNVCHKTSVSINARESFYSHFRVGLFSDCPLYGYVFCWQRQHTVCRYFHVLKPSASNVPIASAASFGLHFNQYLQSSQICISISFPTKQSTSEHY